MTIKNKNILITGAAGHIGSAAALKLFSKGANLMLSDFNLEKLSTIKLNLKSEFDNKFFLFKADITNEEEIKYLIKESAFKMGCIDGALHAAYPKSKQWGKPIEELKLNYINIDLSNQLGSSIYFSKEILNHFKINKKGSLVHISSIYGIRAPKFENYDGTNMTSPIEYAAIKSGIIAICKWLAKYYSNNNVRINCISPGGIFDNQPQLFLNKYRNQCTNFGMLTAEQVTETISFLLSDNSVAINGENIVIDDGWSL